MLRLDDKAMTAQIEAVKKAYKELHGFSRYSATSGVSSSTTTILGSPSSTPFSSPTKSSHTHYLLRTHLHHFVYVNEVIPKELRDQFTDTKDPIQQHQLKGQMERYTRPLIEQLTAILDWASEAKQKRIKLYLIGDLEPYYNFIHQYEDEVATSFRQADTWQDLHERWELLPNEQKPDSLVEDAKKMRRVLDIIALMQENVREPVTSPASTSTPITISPQRKGNYDVDSRNSVEELNVAVLMLNLQEGAESVDELKLARELAPALQRDPRSLYPVSCHYNVVSAEVRSSPPLSTTAAVMEKLSERLRAKYDPSTLEELIKHSADFAESDLSAEELFAKIEAAARTIQSGRELRRRRSIEDKVLIPLTAMKEAEMGSSSSSTSTTSSLDTSWSQPTSSFNSSSSSAPSSQSESHPVSEPVHIPVPEAANRRVTYVDRALSADTGARGVPSKRGKDNSLGTSSDDRYSAPRDTANSGYQATKYPTSRP